MRDGAPPATAATAVAGSVRRRAVPAVAAVAGAAAVAVVVADVVAVAPCVVLAPDVAGRLLRPAVGVLLDHVVEQLLDAVAVGDLRQDGRVLTGGLDRDRARVD